MTDAARPASKLGFFLTPEHDCNYLDDRVARTVFADPDAAPDKRMQTALAAAGFRRSGRFIYRPQCAACRACIPVRLPVFDFTPDRSQRRTLAMNRGLRVVPAALERNPEHLALYVRYQEQRHLDGAMHTDSADAFLEFFASAFSDTWLYEMREGDALRGVMVVDRLDDALSSVYTFFDPELPKRSLGTWAVLWQVAEARRLGLRWVYLGYWIEECRKMAYKGRFRPLERLADGVWHREP